MILVLIDLARTMVPALDKEKVTAVTALQDFRKLIARRVSSTVSKFYRDPWVVTDLLVTKEKQCLTS